MTPTLSPETFGTERAILAVVGPTASGKSDLAVALAQRFGGEIVNADSMQLYRGMDIGTAKLAPDERGGVPHHLIDVLDVTEPATVAEFQTLARTAVAECLRRRAPPILVGGSALYIRAVLDRFTFPGTDPEIRRRLEAELGEVGPAVLHARLRDADPEAAEQILSSNGRRIVRALEVVELTGTRFSAYLPEYSYEHAHTRQLGLDLDRAELDRRIEDRVDRMWSEGLVEEVRRLAARGLHEGRTASRALGYAQVLAFLAGECSEEEARAETVRATRRFARRQSSWFRRDPRIRWLDALAPDLIERAALATGSTTT